MTAYLIEWERIGRNRHVPPTAFNDVDEDVEAVITRAIARHLSSREWGWTLTFPEDGQDGRISIDGGRFGRGTVSDIEAGVVR
jgi:hypothetical protein